MFGSDIRNINNAVFSRPCRCRVYSLPPVIYGLYFAGTRRIYWTTCFRIIEGIAQGLHYLHEQNVVHLDLKPENILFDSDMNPVIVDFGISRVMKEHHKRFSTTTIRGTL
jgi:serine/threonine protein kinase